MSKEIIFEATEAELQSRLDALQVTYDSRKAEMEDDSFWGLMSKGAKVSYINKLKATESEIEKLQRKLERSKEKEAIVEEPIQQQGPYITEPQEEEDDLGEIIAITVPATAPGDSYSINKDELRREVETRRRIEEIVKLIEDLLLDDGCIVTQEINTGLLEILSKFKELKTTSIPEGVNMVSAPTTEEVTPDVLIKPEDSKVLLTGIEEKIDADTKVTLDEFSAQDFKDDIFNNYYVWDHEGNMAVIEGFWGPDKHKTKITINYGDGFLQTEPYYDDEEDYKLNKQIAISVRKGIIKRLKHAGISDTTTKLYPL